MATVFMTVYGKEGLRELAEQNLAKAHYLRERIASSVSPESSSTSSLISTGGKPPEELNRQLLKQKIIGGLPLKKFYPELEDCMLLCATEMNRSANRLDARSRSALTAG